MRNTPVVALAGLLVAAVLAGASLFTVGQTEQVLITQFGEPRQVITEPGLHVKIPFIQTVISFDRRLLDYAIPAEEVILGDQRPIKGIYNSLKINPRHYPFRNVVRVIPIRVRPIKNPVYLPKSVRDLANRTRAMPERMHCTDDSEKDGSAF